MKLFFIALLPGVAGSIAFWLLDRTLLGLPEGYRTPGMIFCLILFSAASLFLFSREKRKSRSMLSNRRIDGDLVQKVGDVSLQGGDVELLSNDVVKGNAEITVGNIESR